MFRVIIFDKNLNKVYHAWISKDKKFHVSEIGKKWISWEKERDIGRDTYNFID